MTGTATIKRPAARALEVKWGVSRGRDTAGYTTCSAYLDGKRRGACNGGGYDLQGTAVGEAIVAEYSDRLLKIIDRAHSRYDRTSDERWSRQDDKYTPKDALYGFYGYWQNGKPHKVGIDGSCGFDSVRNIAEAIGLKLRKISGNSKLDVYTIEDTQPD